MPPRQHHDAAHIGETLLPSTYQGQIQYDALSVADCRHLFVNTKGHSEREMTLFLPSIAHEIPERYAYQYRHWSALLLEENDVDVDEGEAHIFDFSKESLIAFREQQEAWADAKQRLVAEVKDDLIDLDIINEANPAYPFSNGSQSPFGNVRQATSPAPSDHAYNENATSSEGSDDAGDEDDWEDVEESEEGAEADSITVAEGDIEASGRTAAEAGTEHNAVVIGDFRQRLFRAADQLSAYFKRLIRLQKQAEREWREAIIWMNKLSTSNVSQTTWHDLASCWPAVTRAGAPTKAIFDDYISAWFMQSENHSQRMIDDSKYQSPVRDLPGLMERLVMSMDMADDMRLREGLEQNSLERDRSQRVSAILSTPDASSIYLSPWKSALEEAHQWRVFVPPPAAGTIPPNPFRVSAISQKDIHRAYMAGKSEAERSARSQEAVYQIVSFCLPRIVAYLESNHALDTVRRELRKSGFVFDVAEVQKGGRFTVRIVQIKPFGGTSNTRSVAFHWLFDGHKLYNIDGRYSTADEVHVRSIEE